MLNARQLPIEHIVLDAQPRDTAGLYGLIGRLVARPHGPRVDQVVARLSARHARQSAAIGTGLALPHAAVPALGRPCALYLRATAPLDMPAPDDQPVTDVVVLLVPLPGLASDRTLLELLRGRLCDRRLAQRLRLAATPWQVQALLIH